MVITIKCTKATSKVGSLDGMLHVYLIDVNLNEMLTSIYTDDLIAWVRENIGVEEIYAQSELDKWAESEGYIKPETQID